MAATFTYSGAAPASVGDTVAANAYWWLDLAGVGPSVGDNRPVGDADGTLARRRKRGELAAEVRWEVRGETDLSGTPAADRELQLRRNWALLQRWFDDAPGRLVDVTVTDGWTLSGSAHHEEWSTPDWHGLFLQVRQLVVVADGMLEEVTP